MSVIKYAASLLPNFKKDRLLEDVQMVRTELQNNSIPAYRSASEVLDRRVKSKEFKEIEKEYFKAVGSVNSRGMVFDISQRLPQIEKVVAAAEGLVEKEFETEIVVAGVTLYKVSIIRTVELISFVSRYSLRLLNYLYQLETMEVTKEQNSSVTQLSKGEIAELKNGLNLFGRALKSFTTGNKDFVQTLKTVPDVLVNEDTEATLATFAPNKVDPTGIHGLQGFFYNPIYHIGLIVAEHQSVRYKEQQELKLNLELRLMNLKIVQDTGDQDPSLEKEIQMTQSRIDKLSERLRKTEESVGL